MEQDRLRLVGTLDSHMGSSVCPAMTTAPQQPWSGLGTFSNQQSLKHKSFVLRKQVAANRALVPKNKSTRLVPCLEKELDYC